MRDAVVGGATMEICDAAAARRARALCLALVLSLSGLCAVSAEDAGAPRELAEIVVTGTKTAQAVDEAPVPTQVISREQIDATGGSNVEAVLDEIPDLYVRRNEEFRLGASTVRMQGADANKVAILLDGRRFQGGIDGVVDLRDIPAHNVERIEIVRGPASSLYGSDAMAGVINIITRDGGSTPTVGATLAGGTFDRLLASARHGYRIGNLSYFLSYQHDEVALAEQLGAISRQFEGAAGNAKQVRDNAFGKLEYDLSDNQTARMFVNFNPVREGPKSDKANLTTGGDWRWRPSQPWDASLSFNRYGFERDNDLEGFQEDVSYDDWSGDALLSYSAVGSLVGEQHIASFGYSVRSEGLRSAGMHTVGSTGLVFETPAVDERALHNRPYLQDEIMLSDHWSLVVGGSLDLHDRFGAFVSPRLGLSWRPSEQLRVSGSVGRGYRAPDLIQLFDIDANNIVVRDAATGYVILGNRDLDPETDLGATFHVEAKLLRGVDASLQLYRHQFHDLIAVGLLCASGTACPPGFENSFPTLRGQVFRYDNVSAATTQGVDLSLGLEPLEWFAHGGRATRIRLQLGYGYLNARNDEPRPGEGKELPFRPPHRVILTLDGERRDLGIKGRFSAEYEDRTFTDLSNSTDLIADSHWLLGSRFELAPARLLRPNDLARWAGWVYDGVSLFVEVHNLLDEEFGVPSPSGRIAGRRSVLGGVMYDWDKRA